ncbi:MAG: RNA polymerase sigma-70 factor [Chitinophagaceae bacterium]|nr:RNA polymerase sigma-70 factor [Chitinophagaceae bacterium]
MKKYQLYENKLLLVLLSNNDEHAFTELYNRYWKKLFVIAYGKLKELETAEDIVHDVFASLWANRKKITIESLDNYLATAVKYMVLDKLKKKHRERLYMMAYDQPLVVEMPIEAAIHNKRILEAVESEVNKLPERCQLIFKYSRNESMPVKQIAQKLNISPRTVEHQIGKALKQIKLVSRSLQSFF